MELRTETMLEAWREAIRQILEHGRLFIDDDGRECHELTNLIVTIGRPSSAADGVRAMRASRQWRYPSEEELSNIMLNKEAASIYDYLYGQRIFAYNGTVNQIDDYVIPLLKRKPDTRRAVVALLNPAKDLRPEARNVLGISLLHFRILDGKLDMTAVIRTSGFFTGWPANVFQLSKLQEHVAHVLQLPPGRITTVSLAAHLHTESLPDIDQVLGKEATKGIRR